jgi:hypothetical protein
MVVSVLQSEARFHHEVETVLGLAIRAANTGGFNI